MNFEDKASKLKKIIAVLESKMKDSGEGLKDDVKTEIKSLLLRHQLEKKMLNILLDYAKKEPKIPREN
jgi:hypothetical protein